jgi:tyrosyl-tRNA synthetase
MDAAELLARLRERAVEIHVEAHLRRRIEGGDRLRVKLGLDPTAPDIHLGHLVVLDMLRAFQDAGHTVVVIVGDFTALIGDPSGRSETRPVLTREQVDSNARTYFDQLFEVLDRERTEVHGNAEWLGAMDAADLLRLLGRATLQQVLQREDFSSRLREGSAIGAHELLYPLMQGYDSVAIHADVEIGGTDQLFNLLFAREVQRAYGQEPEDIAVFPLLEGVDGVQKMSKSLGNYIAVTEDPRDIYGKAMSVPDSLTERWLRLVSGLEPAAVAAILELPPRDAKAALARRLVERLRGAPAAEEAESAWNRVHRDRRVEPELAPVLTVPNAMNVLELIRQLGWAPTRRKAIEQVEDGAVRLNGEAVGRDAMVGDGDLLQVGKRRLARIRVR